MARPIIPITKPPPPQFVDFASGNGESDSTSHDELALDYPRGSGWTGNRRRRTQFQFSMVGLDHLGSDELTVLEEEMEDELAAIEEADEPLSNSEEQSEGRSTSEEEEESQDYEVSRNKFGKARKLVKTQESDLSSIDLVRPPLLQPTQRRGSQDSHSSSNKSTTEMVVADSQPSQATQRGANYRRSTRSASDNSQQQALRTMPPQARVFETPDPTTLSELPPMRQTPTHTRALRDMITKGTIEEDKARWSKSLYLGYDELVRDLLADDVKLLGDLHVAELDVARHIAASTPLLIFEGVLDGSLVALEATNADVKSELKRIYDVAERCPSIYIHYLVNLNANSAPTPTQLSHIIKCARRYELDDDYSLDIDSIKFPSLDIRTHNRDTTKYRKYFERACRRKKGPDSCPPVGDPTHEAAHDWTPSPLRQKNTRTFCTSLEKRLQQIPRHLWDEPMQIPLSEVGYANNVIRRMGQHRKHEGSNYIMNLVESICELEEMELGIKQFVIYNCFAVEQGAMAEILFARLAHSYIYNGGGFSHHPAGINNHSVWKKNPRRDTWNRHAAYAYTNSPLLENLQWSVNLKLAIFLDEQNKLKEKLKEREEIFATLKMRAGQFYEEEIKSEYNKGDEEKAKLHAIAAMYSIGKELDKWEDLWMYAGALWPVELDTVKDDEVMAAFEINAE